MMTANPVLQSVAMVSTPIEQIMRDESEHRFGNLLQLFASSLDRQARAAGATPTRTALAAASAQVVALGTLQRTLSSPWQGRNADWTEDLRRICNLLEQTTLAPQGHALMFSSQGFSDGEPPCHDITKTLVLIMTEFVINAAKHAFPADGIGTVTVTVSRTEMDITCVVADNGVGLVLDDAAASSRGMGLASQIAERVGGQCQWRFSLLGSRAAVSLPCRQRGAVG